MEESAKEKAIYGLIGRNISYSFSANYFNTRFENEGIAARYINFDIADLSALDEVFETKHLLGCNVTIPYKTSIIDYIDHLDDAAQQIGAVNCLKLTNNQINGYNTDAFGFTKSLQKQLRPTDQSALVLGATGGAAKAIIYALNQLSIQVVTVSRGDTSDFTFEDLDRDTVANTPIIINCTPLGTHPNIDQCPLLPYDTLGPSHYLFDLVYNPSQTLFLKRGAEAGSRTQNGLDMLIYQAEQSWQIWNTP